MADTGYELDETRDQYHEAHRSMRNMHTAGLFWAFPVSIITILVAGRIFNRWKRRSPERQYASWIRYFIGAKFLARIFVFLKALALTSFSPPLLSHNLSVNSGRLFSIVAYGCIVASLLVSVEAPNFSPNFIDDVAFRAAWITLTQIPLVYLLATKRGPLNILAGVSYERVNWIHRWVGRVMFLSATVHMAIMKSSISTSDILFSTDKSMIVVRCGIGAYGTAAWIAVTSILPVRSWNYKAFYINHCISTVAFVVLVLNHIPTHAQLPALIAVGILILDWLVRVCMFMRNNMSVGIIKRRMSRFRRSPRRTSNSFGHSVKMMVPIAGRGASPHVAIPIDASGQGTTVIRICDVRFSWRPGQHIRVYIPQLGKMELHPFTPANCPDTSAATVVGDASDAEVGQLLSRSGASISNEIVLMVQSRSGFTHRLAEYYSRWLSLPCPNSTQPPSSMTAFIDGPFGEPPAWEAFENLVLVTSSTGISFALCVLDYLAQFWFEGNNLRTQKVRVIWTTRHLDIQFDTIVTEMLASHASTLRDAGVSIDIEIYVSCPRSDVWQARLEQYDQFKHLRRPCQLHFNGKPPLRILNPDELMRQDEEQEWSEEELPTDSSQSSFDSRVSSTLIDEDDVRSVAEEISLGPQKPMKRWWQRRVSLPTFEKPSPAKQECNCSFIQYQLTKLKSTASSDLISRFSGYRPDISKLISSAISLSEDGRSMVAACGNPSLMQESKSAVARMNIDFSLERRVRGVEIFTEGYS